MTSGDFKSDKNDILNRENIGPGSLRFWLCVWLGVSVAGGLFGLVIGCMSGQIEIFLLGLIIGFFYAGAIAALLLLNVAIITWAFWLSRFRLAIAVLAGALTGIFSIIGPGWGSVPSGIHWMAIIATMIPGTLGALGAGCFGYWFLSRTEMGRLMHQESKTRKWQFSLAELFVHITVIAVLLGCWSWVIHAIQDAREASLQQHEELMKEYEEILKQQGEFPTQPENQPE